MEEIYAHTFKVEDAIVRPQIISGTHAITLALQSTLKYGDELLYITGSPYDTLLEVIGVNGNGIESLKEHGVEFKEVPLKDGQIDIQSSIEAISEKTKVVAIQRSKGMTKDLQLLSMKLNLLSMQLNHNTPMSLSLWIIVMENL